MSNRISHTGVVESIAGKCVKVRIVQASACLSCKAAKLCNTSESKEKIVDIYVDPSGYTVGQKVTVTATYNAGMFAVALAMLVPLILMVTVLFAMTAAGYDEMTAAFASLSALVPYYIILYLSRRLINRKVTFGIEKAV